MLGSCHASVCRDDGPEIGFGASWARTLVTISLKSGVKFTESHGLIVPPPGSPQFLVVGLFVVSRTYVVSHPFGSSAIPRGFPSLGSSPLAAPWR